MNITANKEGDRVELIKCTDPYTKIPPGTQGKVDFVDAIGTVHVTWDNGYSLGLVPGEDKWWTLIHQASPGTALVDSKEFGSNCWHPCRFIKDDGRCHRLYVCIYPERKNCQAVHAEITHLKKTQVRLMNTSIQIDHTIETLAEMLQK
ncbi:hypothetical protein LCGC14_2086000 [marine sediment metagenome]|uniref:DUF4314 domain-containing protein n=1 Tax=marine sediment metagenome TaxID=412755 RepID=A0A0F9F1J2_9ZZZZ